MAVVINEFEVVAAPPVAEPEQNAPGEPQAAEQLSPHEIELIMHRHALRLARVAAD